jgi:hypothetical protein
VTSIPFPSGPGPKWFEEFSGLMANYVAGQAKMSVLYGTYFCAQLVADSYMHMSLLNMDEWPPNSYSPADFARTDKAMPFVTGVSLDTPFPIDFDWTCHTDPPQDCPQAAALKAAG